MHPLGMLKNNSGAFHLLLHTKIMVFGSGINSFHVPIDAKSAHIVSPGMTRCSVKEPTQT